MRNPQRIDIVLSKINFDQFILSNSNNLTAQSAEILAEKIEGDIDKIRTEWRKYPDLRLGQLLIIKGYVPDNYRMFNVEEDDWMIENGICSIQDIKFWGNNYDINRNRLTETVYILLKDMNDGHVQAIIDLEDSGMMRVRKDYLDYFKSRLVKDGKEG